MINLDNISNIENNKKSPIFLPNINKTSANRWNISCEHFRYKRCIPILACIIIIPIVVTVPIVLVRNGNIKTNITITTTTTITTTAIEVSLDNIITNTTKWKQDGITVFHSSDFDPFNANFNSMYIDDEETIYLAEVHEDRVIELKLNTKHFQVVAGGNESGDGTHQFWIISDIIVDKKSDSMIICDMGNRRIVRWPRQNGINGDIIISNIYCNGLAIDKEGFLYVSDYMGKEVRRWEIGVNNKSTIVAGGNGEGNNLAQINTPGLMFVDKDYSVYVVDVFNHRVMKWMKNATQGIIVAGGNGNGVNLTQLSQPSGVTVDHLGNVYVTDTYNHRVMRWINGAKEGSIVVGGNGPGNETNQLHLPSDLLFDKHGNLYVFDSVNYRIQKFEIESN